MKTISQPSKVEFIERKSRFVGQAAPVENESAALAFIEEICRNNRDASHNVYAYIIKDDSNRQYSRFSDDGEPSGTAGFPVYNIIKNNNLSNIVVVITRFFGGILLGTGGLVRAYSKTANMAIESAGIVEKLPYNKIFVTVDYGIFDKVKYELIKSGFVLEDLEYFDKISFSVLTNIDKVEELNTLITKISNGKALINISNEIFIV